MSSVLAFLHRAGAFLLALMGGWDGTLRLLLVMMALDYLSGLVAACLGRSPHTLSGCIDSRAGLTGLLRKGLILMVLAVAAQIDTTIDGTFVRRGHRLVLYRQRGDIRAGKCGHRRASPAGSPAGDAGPQQAEGRPDAAVNRASSAAGRRRFSLRRAGVLFRPLPL